MTNELSPKVAATLIRTAFSSKGAAISHTEALDLMAKLKGFEAWSHMQQATKTTKPVKAKAVKPLTEASLKSLVINHFGLTKEWPIYPRSACERAHNAAGNAPLTDVQYWDYTIERAEEEGVLTGDDMFFIGQAIPVTLPSGQASTWNIEQNLTDRWGEFNDYNSREKAGLELLQLDTPLYNKLLEMMPMEYEMAFMVRKDQKLGILFEAEFCSVESEEVSGNDHAEGELEHHDNVVGSLLHGLKNLKSSYPNVEFCVPDASQVVNDRPAVWAFFLPDTLSKEQRNELAEALYEL